MILYLDTSALVKLVFEEPESVALEQYVHGHRIVASALSRVELRRVALRVDPAQLPVCDLLLDSTLEVQLIREILDDAGIEAPPALRSLDAIHLSCGRALGDELDAFVAYDERLLQAATAVGLPVASPG